jgi:hypothetical protein
MAIRRLPRLSELPSEISGDEFWGLFGDMDFKRARWWLTGRS